MSDEAIPGDIMKAAKEVADAIPIAMFQAEIEIIARAIQAERARCLAHAEAPHYGELTTEAEAEARRIALRIRSGGF